MEHVAVDPDRNQYQYDSFSPDGASIAIAWDQGSDQRGTYLLDLQTWRQTEIPEFNNGATFSPDGRHLINSVYVDENNTDIARLEIDTGKVSIISPDDSWDWLPSYSPDGRKVLFNSFRSGNSDLYLYNLDTEQLEQLTNSPNYEAHAQYSPDGQSIIYHEQVSASDFNIKQLTLPNSEPVDLTQRETEDSYPSWSPDGRFVAYASDQGQQPGITDIFIMTTDGKTLQRVTNTPHKDAYPFWSPDGEYLYFTSYREPQGVYRTPMRDMVHCRREAG